jgi:hypothetical protein
MSCCAYICKLVSLSMTVLKFHKLKKKLWEISQSSLRHLVKMKQVSYLGPTDNRHHLIKCSSLGDLAPGFVHCCIRLYSGSRILHLQHNRPAPDMFLHAEHGPFTKWWFFKILLNCTPVQVALFYRVEVLVSRIGGFSAAGKDRELVLAVLEKVTVTIS